MRGIGSVPHNVKKAPMTNDSWARVRRGESSQLVSQVCRQPGVHASGEIRFLKPPVCGLAKECCQFRHKLRLLLPEGGCSVSWTPEFTHEVSKLCLLVAPEPRRVGPPQVADVDGELASEDADEGRAPLEPCRDALDHR